MLSPETLGYCILLGNWGLPSESSVFKNELRKGFGTILLKFKQKNNRVGKLYTPEAAQRKTGKRKLASPCLS